MSRTSALSPCGSKVAFIAPVPASRTSSTRSRSAAAPSRVLALSADGKPERLSGCGWVSEERLVCTIFMVIDESARRGGRSARLA